MGAKHFPAIGFAILFFLTSLSGQGGFDWQSKIDSVILQKAIAGESVDFIVLLGEQADLSEARFLTKKEEKGAFVFQKLIETAQRTQGNVLKIITEFRAPYQPFWIMNAVRARGGISLLEALARLPEVEEIQSNPNLKLENQGPETNRGDCDVPWGIAYINADDVWAMGYTGSGVVIGGQDTGYQWDHPALKLKYRGWNNTTMTADHNYNWHDAITANDPHNTGTNPCGYSLQAPCDDTNHGTHTMGTMAGDGGAGYQIGVAPGAKWIGCRNMERGWGMLSTYMDCFQWFLAPKNLAGANPNSALAPHVINNSWYCPNEEGCDNTNYGTMEAVVNNLRMAGVVVVASAGNSGPGCGTVNYPPAMFSGSFSVGATNSSGGIASFSSRGPATYNSSTYLKPNVSAPGSLVLSSIPGNNYGCFSGTSMAGPHVVGAVALVISANPSLAGQVVQIETIFQSTATGTTTTDGCGGNTSTSIPNNTYGYGIIDAQAAVNLALALLPVELLDFTGMVEGSGVRLNWETALQGSLNHFEIEYADNRFQWEMIGKVAFSPNSPAYSFLHKTPSAGVNFYRLKMVDIGGNVEYSKTIAVQLAGSENLMIFPNPTAGVLSLVAKWKPDEVKIRIFDAGGRLVQEVQEQVGKEQARLFVDVAALPAGIYFIRILTKTGEGALFQNKFVKF